jgi:GMP synthase (glutamine-hydrolysing)
MTAHETVVILDFGSQYTQLIARRVRELNVKSEILPPQTPVEEIQSRHPIGLILSGGPASVYEEGAARPDPGIFSLGVPVLGLCYGQQVMAQLLGGEVAAAERREFGAAELSVDRTCPLFAGLPPAQRVWMSHGDKVTKLPPGFRVVAHTANAPHAAMAWEERKLFGLQFHPEVKHTDYGLQILDNFLTLCGARRDWTPASLRQEAVAAIREKVQGGQVIVALSGGVDSTVTALLCGKRWGRLRSPFSWTRGCCAWARATRSWSASRTTGWRCTG